MTYDMIPASALMPGDTVNMTSGEDALVVSHPAWLAGGKVAVKLMDEFGAFMATMFHDDTIYVTLLGNAVKEWA